MKTQFPEFYRPTDAEFRSLWADCLFAVDANVLLNVYGYSIETREALISLFESIAPRLRMPYQFAVEYHRNRAKAVMEQVKNYAKVEKILNDVYKEDLEPKQKHPFLTKQNFAAFRRIQADLSDGRKKHEALLSADQYAERIASIFTTVGAKPSNLIALHDKARQRYTTKIPPGFADVKDKAEPDCFGDCVGWFQILEIGKAEQKPLILLTDDSKEDWWHIQSDRTIGPRPELVAEYISECGKPFYMYSSGRFMDLAANYLNRPVEKKAIEEVKLRFAEQIRAFLEEEMEKPGASSAFWSEFSSLKPEAAIAPQKPDDLKPTSESLPSSSEKPSAPSDDKGAPKLI